MKKRNVNLTSKYLDWRELLVPVLTTFCFFTSLIFIPKAWKQNWWLSEFNDPRTEAYFELAAVIILIALWIVSGYSWGHLIRNSSSYLELEEEELLGIEVYPPLGQKPCGIPDDLESRRFTLSYSQVNQVKKVFSDYILILTEQRQYLCRVGRFRRDKMMAEIVCRKADYILNYMVSDAEDFYILK